MLLTVDVRLVIEVSTDPNLKHEDLYVKTGSASGLTLGSGIGLEDDLEFRVVFGEVISTAEADGAQEDDGFGDDLDDLEDEEMDEELQERLDSVLDGRTTEDEFTGMGDDED